MVIQSQTLKQGPLFVSLAKLAADEPLSKQTFRPPHPRVIVTECV